MGLMARVLIAKAITVLARSVTSMTYVWLVILIVAQLQPSATCHRTLYERKLARANPYLQPDMNISDGPVFVQPTANRNSPFTSRDHTARAICLSALSSL